MCEALAKLAPWHHGILAPWHLGILASWHLGNLHLVLSMSNHSFRGRPQAENGSRISFSGGPRLWEGETEFQDSSDDEFQDSCDDGLQDSSDYEFWDASNHEFFKWWRLLRLNHPVTLTLVRYVPTKKLRKKHLVYTILWGKWPSVRISGFYWAHKVA